MTDLLTKSIPLSEAILTAPCFDEEEEALDRAVALAVREALLDHKRAGNPVAIWEDVKVRIVQPEDIILPEETAQPIRASSKE